MNPSPHDTPEVGRHRADDDHTAWRLIVLFWAGGIGFLSVLALMIFLP